ncbi:YKL162C [Saccharomyces arboricola H-6]|uniref:Protein arginine methyltransferase NDUFAF7 n=1 Tax=Saccharomyces arboricola (strain H-6 / AS 2.3317 / CBS 10644) TaxID=1160507 RepID=J8PLI9_SACAR|nr:YKL162C [Saccharomyces arboricola H-6]
MMKRFFLLRMQARQKSDYPLRTFEQLVSTNGIRKGQTGRTPLRDYIEWQNFPNIMKRENFFTQRKRMSLESKEDTFIFDNILDHGPTFSKCLAKWLLVNYKLNDYPYYDLNVVNIYTDLPQAIQLCRSLMTYLKSTLSETMFQKIKYFMIPLYRCDNIPSKLLDGIPGSVTLVQDYPISPTLLRKKFLIDDPVQILMINDVIKYTTHDLVRFSSDVNAWQQCFVEVNEKGQKNKVFDSELDYSCKLALEQTFDDQSSILSDSDLYIPTKLIEILMAIKNSIPEHRIFAVDTPQRSRPTIIALLKSLLGSRSTGSSLMIEEPYSDSISSDKRSGRAYFTTDFLLLQKIYNDINISSRSCEVEDISDFVDKWISPSERGTHSLLGGEKSHLEAIKNSSLAILHST